MMTIFAMFALCGRDRDNPSLRTRSTANFEQRMEIVGGGVPAPSPRLRRTTWWSRSTPFPHVRVRGLKRLQVEADWKI